MTLSNAPSTEFNFFLSSDLDLPVKIKINRLEGCLIPATEFQGSQQRPLAVYVEAVISAHGEVLGLPCRTRWATPDPHAASCSWSGWLTFPIKYRDLPHNAQLAVSVWGLAEARPLAPLAGATMRLFSKKARMKDGQQTLQLTLGREADLGWPPATPGKVPLAQRSELGRVEQVWKRYQRRELQQVEWLDGLAFHSIDELRQQEAERLKQSPQASLIVQLQTFPYAVIYHQAAAGPTASGQPIEKYIQPSVSGLVVLNDPEVGRSNPAELKAQKLARSGATGADRDAKPDVEERRRIAAILNYPPNRELKGADKALLWRFRWALTSEKRALTRVLACVDWSDAAEARQAAALTAAWAPVDTATALELLSPEFSNPEVRGQAVEVLERADDEELACYLLQLVAALRYEPSPDSRLSRFLLSRASANRDLGIALHWLLYSEFRDPSFGMRAAQVHTAFQAAIETSQPDVLADISNQMTMVAQLRHIAGELRSIRGGGAARKATALRAMLSPGGSCGNLGSMVLTNPLDPRVQLQGIVPAECSVFKSALSPLRLAFRTADVRDRSQEALDLDRVTPPDAADPADVAVSPAHSTEAARRHQQEESDRSGAGRYIIIYKAGDDLRQDQFVLQMFSLMDRLLKRENLDLKLTPYRVLPMSADDGMIEYVPSVSLARVLAEHRTIACFLQLHAPDPNGPYGLKAEVLDTFVKSCAGYCVMTHILGIGDRHLDNLMLCTDGRLFHIDFGFIMGRDPKPFPPPMKLCKEMVEVMGGAEGEAYKHFRTLACEAYNILRANAGLLLSLLHLMAGAAISDLATNPAKALSKLQETLRLEMDDEEAVQWMQQLLNESVTALMPQIMENAHKWAQYWR